jgi:hypothetical protein
VIDVSFADPLREHPHMLFKTVCKRTRHQFTNRRKISAYLSLLPPGISECAAPRIYRMSTERRG